MSKLIKNVIVGCLLLVGVSVSAGETNGVNKNPFVLSLSGGGSTTLKGDNETSGGAMIELGKQGRLLLNVEAGTRLGAQYSTATDDAVFDGRLYFDVFPVKFHRVEIGAGLNVGAQFGNTPVVYSAAPEAIIRLYVKEDVALFLRGEVPLDLGSNKLGDRVNYFLGVSFRW